MATGVRSPGDNDTCALLATRTIRCWGLADSGQVGAGRSATATPMKPAAASRHHTFGNATRSCGVQALEGTAYAALVDGGVRIGTVLRRSQTRSKRSRFITLVHAATKSSMNFSPAS